MKTRSIGYNKRGTPRIPYWRLLSNYNITKNIIHILQYSGITGLRYKIERETLVKIQVVYFICTCNIGQRLDIIMSNDGTAHSSITSAHEYGA